MRRAYGVGGALVREGRLCGGVLSHAPQPRRCLTEEALALTAVSTCLVPTERHHAALRERSGVTPDRWCGFSRRRLEGGSCVGPEPDAITLEAFGREIPDQ